MVKKWGFGQFQLSLWITPHPLGEVIDEFIQSNKLESYAFRFSTRKLKLTKGNLIAEKTWDLTKLQVKMKKFINKWFVINKDAEHKSNHMKFLESDYSTILEADPYLPFELLPTDWLAEEARTVYMDAKAALSNQKK